MLAVGDNHIEPVALPKGNPCLDQRHAQTTCKKAQDSGPTNVGKVDGLGLKRFSQHAVILAWPTWDARGDVTYGDDQQNTWIPHAYASIAMGAGNNSVKFAKGSRGGSINSISRIRSTLAISRVTSIWRAGWN